MLWEIHECSRSNIMIFVGVVTEVVQCSLTGLFFLISRMPFSKKSDWLQNTAWADSIKNSTNVKKLNTRRWFIRREGLLPSYRGRGETGRMLPCLLSFWEDGALSCPGERFRYNVVPLTCLSVTGRRTRKKENEDGYGMNSSKHLYAVVPAFLAYEERLHIDH